MLSRALQGVHQFDEARIEAIEAIRLNPDDALFFGRLASIELLLGNTSTALKAAERGLAIDPNSTVCQTIQAELLNKMGRRTAALNQTEGALSQKPNDSLIHASRGWMFLREGTSANAIEHFRESLRLDPNQIWAQTGFIEALKSRNALYRLLTKHVDRVWGPKLRVRFLLLAGCFFVLRLLSYNADTQTAIGTVVRLAEVLTVFIVTLFFIACPLFNYFSTWNHEARLTLTRRQILEAKFVFALTICALICGIYFIATDIFLAGIAGCVFVMLAALTEASLRCHEGWPRNTLIGLTIGFAIVEFLGIGLLSAKSYIGIAKVESDRIAFLLSESLFPIAIVFLIIAKSLAVVLPKR